MKKILLILSVLMLLTSCSQKGVNNITTNTVEVTSNDDVFTEDTKEYIENYKESIENEEFPTTPTLYLKINGEYRESEILNFSEKTVEVVAREVEKMLNLNFRIDTVTENETSIIVNFKEENSPSRLSALAEVTILDSIAKTLHKNYKKDIIFTINNREYNSNLFYFGINEVYPTDK